MVSGTAELPLQFVPQQLNLRDVDEMGRKPGKWEENHHVGIKVPDYIRDRIPCKGNTFRTPYSQRHSEK